MYAHINPQRVPHMSNLKLHTYISQYFCIACILILSFLAAFISSLEKKMTFCRECLQFQNLIYPSPFLSTETFSDIAHSSTWPRPLIPRNNLPAQMSSGKVPTSSQSASSLSSTIGGDCGPPKPLTSPSPRTQHRVAVQKHCWLACSNDGELGSIVLTPPLSSAPICHHSVG